MAKQQSKKFFKAPKFKFPDLPDKVSIPKINYSSYVYTYHTTLDTVSEYLKAHGIELSRDATMCARMDWWYDYYREISKMDGIAIQKEEKGCWPNTTISLSIAKSFSKPRSPSDLDKITANNTCKSIW